MSFAGASVDRLLIVAGWFSCLVCGLSLRVPAGEHFLCRSGIAARPCRRRGLHSAASLAAPLVAPRRAAVSRGNVFSFSGRQYRDWSLIYTGALRSDWTLLYVHIGVSFVGAGLIAASRISWLSRHSLVGVATVLVVLAYDCASCPLSPRNALEAAWAH